MPKQQPWDRRSLVPPDGAQDYVLPCDPLFTRLLTLACRQPQRPAIRDLKTGQERNYAELLSDVVNFRKVLRSSLPPKMLEALDNGEEVYISLLVPGGYDFAVGVLAVLSCGAAASPISSHQPVREAVYYVNKARSAAVVVSDSTRNVGDELAAEIQQSTNPSFVCVPVSAGLDHIYRLPRSLVISSRGYCDLNRPGIVIFTSGTTGPPKGAVLPLAALVDGSFSAVEHMQICDTDVLQHLLPVHHATGTVLCFYPFILAGACIEFKSGSFDPQWTWERWKKGGITHFSGVPTIYMRMMRHYQEKLSKLPAVEQDAYRQAPSRFRAALCGTSALPKPIDDFWTEMMNGRKIIQRYGSTEQGVVFHMPFLTDADLPDGSVGEAAVGMEVKLSEGDEGEVLTKSSVSFSKYIHDPEATRAAFDKQGYFKSGDMAIKKGKYYIITGRSSVDILKSGGYKISALDVEREILSLPYVNEVMVVGVPDEEFGQRVGAVLSLIDSDAALAFYRKHGRQSGMLELDDLRADLRSRLAGYKMPTLLRVVDGELPKSATNKVVKKVLGPMYFPANYTSVPEVQRWRGSLSRQTKL